MKLKPDFFLRLSAARKQRGLSLAAPIFRPNLHPRDHKGRFTEVFDEVEAIMDRADAGPRDYPNDYELPGGHVAMPVFYKNESPSWDVYGPDGKIVRGEQSESEVAQLVAEQVTNADRPRPSPAHPIEYTEPVAAEPDEPDESAAIDDLAGLSLFATKPPESVKLVKIDRSELSVLQRASNTLSAYEVQDRQTGVTLGYVGQWKDPGRVRHVTQGGGIEGSGKRWFASTTKKRIMDYGIAAKRVDALITLGRELKRSRDADSV